MLQSWFGVVAPQFSGQSSKFITERQAMDVTKCGKNLSKAGLEKTPKISQNIFRLVFTTL